MWSVVFVHIRTNIHVYMCVWKHMCDSVYTCEFVCVSLCVRECVSEPCTYFVANRRYWNFHIQWSLLYYSNIHTLSCTMHSTRGCRKSVVKPTTSDMSTVGGWVGEGRRYGCDFISVSKWILVIGWSGKEIETINCQRSVHPYSSSHGSVNLALWLDQTVW